VGTRWGASGGLVNGMQGVRGSNPLSSTPSKQGVWPGWLPSSRANPIKTPIRQDRMSGRPAIRRFEIVGASSRSEASYPCRWARYPAAIAGVDQAGDAVKQVGLCRGFHRAVAGVGEQHLQVSCGRVGLLPLVTAEACGAEAARAVQLVA
jgi:hypothetical protein